jgi:hypothetical protein
MAAWADFFPWVKPSVPGCPDFAIERAICDAAIEFCEMTQAFQERASLKIKTGKATYPLSTNSGIPGMVLGVTGNNERVLSPVYIEALTNAYGEEWKNHTGSPKHYLADDEDTLRLYPIPEADETGTLTVTTRPSRTDTEWDDRLFERYGEIIADGALGRLQLQVGTPWADTQSGSFRRTRFTQGVSKVRAKIQTGITPATLYAQFA